MIKKNIGLVLILKSVWAQNFGIGASLRVTLSRRMACRKLCTVKVYESLLIVRSVINYGALSQLGMLVEENGRRLSPFSYLLPVIARVVFTGTASDWEYNRY